MADEKTVKKEKRQKRNTTQKSAHRAKFALCAKLCRGDSACMSRCLKPSH